MADTMHVRGGLPSAREGCPLAGLRVLHVYRYCFSDNIGGIERHLDLLGRGCAARGLDVSLLVSQPHLTPWQITETVTEGVRVVRLPRVPEIMSGTWSPQMGAWAHRFDANIVHLHWPHPAAMPLAASLPPSVRLVVTYHCDVVRQRRLLRLAGRWFDAMMERADAVITTSREIIVTSEWLPPWRDKCRVIPYGIDLDAFVGCDEALRSAATLALRARFGPRTAMFVGRLVGFKGLDVLLDAWAGVDGHLVIVGDGPQRAALETRAGRPDLQGRVTFAGAVRDALPAWYAAADVVVLPSVTRVESFGLVQVEAHACGVPVVSTRVNTGVEAVNPHGVTGLLVAPGDVRALRDALSALLDDPARRRTLGEEARRRAQAEYGHTLMIDRTLALYAELRGR